MPRARAVGTALNTLEHLTGQLGAVFYQIFTLLPDEFYPDCCLLCRGGEVRDLGAGLADELKSCEVTRKRPRRSTWLGRRRG